MIYDLFVEADGTIFLYEAWRSQEDLDRHLQKPYVRDFVRRSPDWLEGINDAYFGILRGSP